MMRDEALYEWLTKWEAAAPHHKLVVLGYWRQDLTEARWQRAVLSLALRLPTDAKLALVCLLDPPSLLLAA